MLGLIILKQNMHPNIWTIIFKTQELKKINDNKQSDQLLQDK